MNALIAVQRLVPAWESLESAWVRAETLVVVVRYALRTVCVVRYTMRTLLQLTLDG